ncbi:MAG: glycosyl hydrolase family 79 C-terminal domain-containing protein [Myxococcota bacterium]|nr:glycosyl hydrolase family 79 C-terminal domain-containing protein [Myxococcota bacterium]
MTDAFFTGSNAPLIALYNLLGPGVMRISANDVDKTTWVPTAPQVAGGSISPNVGTVAVDGLAAFLSATGWKAIYGVRHQGSTPAAAASEATYVAKQLGAGLSAFEIGNEPNFYGGGWAGFKPSWDAFTSAIRTAVPNAPMSGPGAFGASGSASTGYADAFARDEAAQIVLLTQHYYIAGAGGGSTLADIVSAKPAVVSMSQSLSADVVQNKIRDGFRWTEMNSYAHHGAPGVSDAMGAALWGIDFMLTTASYGSSGVNFHGGGTGMDGTVPFTYSPIQEAGSQVVAAKPLYYGMLLVSRAGVGNMLATTARAGSLNFTGYTITPADGSTNVVLVNKDTSSGVMASVDMGTAVSGASAIYLQAPSLGATTGLTFAGAAVSPKGSWTPNPPYALPTKGSVATVVVPPASAVIVHAQ